jgi:hypothetical protein
MTTPSAIAWVGDAAGRIECQVLSASIHHGRDDPSSQPEASTATLELVGVLPAEVAIGARVRVSAVLGGVEYPRFDGEITDVEVGWDTVDLTRPRIIAAGDLGRLGRRPIGDVPWPAELDGARVARILQLAGFPPAPLETDPGTVQILARDVDRQPALALAQSTAIDGAGVLWQDRAGAILYADALHRRGVATSLELDACDVGLGLGWAATLEGLCNEAHIRYGVAPDGGEQPEVTASDPVSIAERGLYGESLTTQLATAADAQRRADVTVARQAAPAWVLGGLEVDLGALDPVRTAQLLELVEIHELLSITGLPAGSPATSALLWVEGWRETIEGGAEPGAIAWSVAYATSDYCRTAAPPLWDDLAAALTWDSVDPALTWNSSTCIPPQPSRGRWNDAPASLRWDTIDPAATWDTWAY